MEKISESFLSLLEKPEDYLRPNDKIQLWVNQTKNVYNFMKKEEEKYGLPAPAESLSCLDTDGLDTEQIWQLLELQNKNLLAASDNLEDLDEVNLCYSVAKLSSLANYGKLVDTEMQEEEEEDKGKVTDDDSSLSEDSEIEADPNDQEEGSEDDEDEGMGSLDDEDALSDDESLSKDVGDDGGLNLNFDNESDDEEDNFDKFIAPEGMEDSDEEDADFETSKVLKKDNPKENKDKNHAEDSDDDENEDISDKSDKIQTDKDKTKELLPKEDKSSKVKKFKKTEVDSQFFRLRECEWVADNDFIGDNYDMDSDDIDLMEDIPDGDKDDESNVMYDGFFNNAKQSQEGTKDKEGSKNDDHDDEEVDDDEEDDSESNFDEKQDDINKLEMETGETDSEDDNSEVTPLLGVKKKEEKSSFEKDRERELMLMSTLEEDNIGEKAWFLKGEAVGADRPENSTIEEHLEYNIAARQRPVVTEDTTTLVEKIILSRIRAKAWDDVARVVKPNVTPFEYKKKLLLNQDKSKKSLAEIYEEEYLKQQKKNEVEEKKELPEHKEIREKMDDLFGLLDALSNYHYMPKARIAEVKVKSNLPAITMEESTPVTATDATLLAPQEVLAPVQGELQGETELTSTDKNRKRRFKKAKQRALAKKDEDRLRAKLKKTSDEGKKLDVKSTVKFVEKAVKAGQVKMLEGQDKKSVKSSQAFFKKLQDTTKGNSNGKGLGETKKKKKRESNISASKLLL